MRGSLMSSEYCRPNLEHGANRRQPVVSVCVREPAAAASGGSCSSFGYSTRSALRLAARMALCQFPSHPFHASW